ncbi:hypothetical protein PR048_028808 [Dryococelus australis]|uniref:Uncharacterized protein n=1 Tax=Dryococelus australis TaxID=614101 RepID=A0ABQ9GBK2_9NEOP|nr:hypothetical protein PR048_028808 [Dryococelus australis]
MSMEQRRNEGAGETGDPRENPSTSRIVRIDSHMRKPGGGGRPRRESNPVRFAERLVREGERPTRSETSGWPQLIVIHRACVTNVATQTRPASVHTAGSARGSTFYTSRDQLQSAAPRRCCERVREAAAYKLFTLYILLGADLLREVGGGHRRAEPAETKKKKGGGEEGSLPARVPPGAKRPRRDWTDNKNLKCQTAGMHRLEEEPGQVASESRGCCGSRKWGESTLPLHSEYAYAVASGVPNKTTLSPRQTGFDSGRGCSRIFALLNRAGRCRWSAGFLGDLPFPPPFRFGAAPYTPRFALVGDLRGKSKITFLEDYESIKHENPDGLAIPGWNSSAMETETCRGYVKLFCSPPTAVQLTEHYSTTAALLRRRTNNVGDTTPGLRPHYELNSPVITQNLQLCINNQHSTAAQVCLITPANRSNGGAHHSPNLTRWLQGYGRLLFLPKHGEAISDSQFPKPTHTRPFFINQMSSGLEL